MKKIHRGFTLIELLIVIGIIAILASAIIIAINPGQQFAQARDATRQGHINSINKAILSYMISHYGDLSGLNLPPTPTEICALGAGECTGLVDLTPLIEGGHLSAVPTDPSGGVLTNGTGYRIFTYGSDPAIHASNSETRTIQAGNWSFTDTRDGNTYKTVLIGDQLWMAENLKYLPSVVGSATGGTDPYYYVYGYQGTSVSEAKATDNYNNHGVLYNYPAAMISCPTGWHLPTDTQWNTLEQYVVSVINSSNTQYPCSTSETGWRRCADDTGTDQGANGVGQALKQLGIGSGVGLGTDLVSFTGKLSGYRSTDTNFYSIGTYGLWWSSTPSSGNAWYRSLYSSYSTVLRNALNQGGGFSVRCLRD